MERPTDKQPTTAGLRPVSLRPKSSRTMKPASGNAGMSHKRSATLSPHVAGPVDIDSPFIVIKPEHERKPYGNLRSRDRKDEDRT